MKRRQFIKTCSYSAPVAGLLSGCKQQSLAQQYLPNAANQLVFDRTLVPAGASYLLRHPGSKFPIAVSQLDDMSYSACLMDCTHQHCETSPSPSGFVCPCHGARYDKVGQVIAGPASQNLTRYPISLNANLLTIQLD